MVAIILRNANIFAHNGCLSFARSINKIESIIKVKEEAKGVKSGIPGVDE